MTLIHLRVTDVTEGWYETDGVDVGATNTAYCNRLDGELRKVYPDAEIRVEYLPNVTGAVSHTIQADDHAEEYEIENMLSVISDRLMNDSDSWTVMVSK